VSRKGRGTRMRRRRQWGWPLVESSGGGGGNQILAGGEVLGLAMAEKGGKGGGKEVGYDMLGSHVSERGEMLGCWGVFIAVVADCH